jgi:hypothetical protein
MMHGGNMEMIPTADRSRWQDVLDSCYAYDFYHTPEYHALSEETSGGQAILFVYREGPLLAAWPFMLQLIHAVHGLEQAGLGYRDATSVYGYPGSVSNSAARGSAEFAYRFGVALAKSCRDLNLVSLFSRLHPLLENVIMAHGLGTVTSMGETVSIDLTRPPTEQWAGYRKTHRYDIRRAREKGIQVSIDDGWERFDDFYRLYTNTMNRVKASERYFFSKQYFYRLREILGGRLKLFHAYYEGEVCASSLFVRQGDIIQYHLSGSDPLYSKFSPSKVIVDEARLWGVSSGAKRLHLGGGLGANHDGLLQFKSGFSHRHHEFFVWHHIIIPEVYGALTEARCEWLSARMQEVSRPDFFPAYRMGEE